MESFDKEFSKLRELGANTFKLRGSTLIVELQEQEIKTKSGIVLQAVDTHTKGGSLNQNRLDVGKVLMVGEGYWDDDNGSYEDLEVKVGAVVILPQFATQIISTFPGINRPTNQKLALVKFDQILAYYPTVEAFERAQAELNA